MKSFFYIFFLPIIVFASLSENILDKMSLDEKIGQLFMIPACPLREEDHYHDLIQIIEKYHIGGVIVKASDPETQIDFLNKLQNKSKYPLLVSADAEWGLGMIMTNVISYPKNKILREIENVDLIYKLGKEIAKQLKAVGVHINLAPVVDVSLHEKDYINVRSFGSDPKKVSYLASLFVKGLQEENILACAKHFPGYGDVVVDPHKNLPIAYHDRKRLDKIEFVPYVQLIKEDVSCIMTAHILLPNLDDKPATLSKKITQIIRDDFSFNGLIITDALNMKALIKSYSIEEIALLSHMAGHDILLYGDHINPNIDDILNRQIPIAFEALKQAYLDKRLDITNLNKHVLRILRAKEKLKLYDQRYSSKEDLKALHSQEAYELLNKLSK